jgi:hypothetical protein
LTFSPFSELTHTSTEVGKDSVQMNKFLKALRVTAVNLMTLAAVVAISSLAGYGVGAIVMPPNELVLAFVSFMFLFLVVGPGMFLSGFSRSFLSGAHKMFYFSLSQTALCALLCCWYVSPQTPDIASFLRLLVDTPLVVAVAVFGLPLFIIVLIGEWVATEGD